ncbi:MAG: hypothetical protein GY855_08975 [candidate division Zixibacteria bacterium]|nr:hypothetical protein [candidate division Zixibacteria bacterium]
MKADTDKSLSGEEEEHSHDHAIIKADSTFTDDYNKLFKPNPTGALLRSVVIPGWGQFYNKKYIKAGVVAAGESILLYYLIDNWKKVKDYEKKFNKAELDSPEQADAFANWQHHTDERNKYIWFTTAAIFLSMFDAFVDAHLISFEYEMKEDLKQAGLKLNYYF